MSWGQSAYTETGIHLLTESIDGKRLVITQAISGTETVVVNQLPDQTDVIGEKHTLELFGIETVGEGKGSARRIKIRITGAEDTYTMHQIGIFGRQEGTEKDVLLMLIQDEYGVEIPSSSSNAEFEIIFSAVLAISSSANISVSLSPEISALKLMMEQELAKHNADRTAHLETVRSEVLAYIERLNHPAKVIAEMDDTYLRLTEIVQTPLHTASGDALETADGQPIEASIRVIRTAKTLDEAEYLPVSLGLLKQCLGGLTPAPTPSTTTATLGKAVVGRMVLGTT